MHCVSPCKNCTKRAAKCHSTCREYIEWHNEERKGNAALRKWTYERIPSVVFTKTGAKHKEFD